MRLVFKAGPFIGPRGGKWADPEHTIPWKPDASARGSTYHHGSHRGTFVPHVGLCLTEDVDVAETYATRSGEIFSVDIDFSKLRVVEIDAGYDRETNEAPGDQDPDELAEKYNADVIVFDDEDERGRSHTTWRIVSEDALEAIVDADKVEKSVGIRRLYVIQKRSRGTQKSLVFKAEKHVDRIPGGLADKKKPSDFDPAALRAGIKVELEHTSDRAIAREIAMDHLTEDPQYYKKLKKIEKGGPYFGPRGGKWADPAHTIPWRELSKEHAALANHSALQIVEDGFIDPDHIETVNAIQDREKFQSILSSMQDHGWIGPPVVLIKTNAYNEALTGSHRVIAARKLELEVPYVEVPEDEFEEDDFDELRSGDDDTRLDVLKRVLGESHEVVKLFDYEVTKNWLEKSTKPYGHTAYTRRSKGGKMVFVQAKGVKPRTGLLRVPEGTVNKLTDKLTSNFGVNQHGIVRRVDEGSARTAIKTPDGSSIKVYASLIPVSDLSDPRGVSGALRMYPNNEAELTIRVRSHDGQDHKQLMQKIRSVVAHELTHAADPSIRRRLEKRKAEGDTRQRKDTREPSVESYYNEDKEVTARLQQVARDLIDTKSVKEYLSSVQDAEGDPENMPPAYRPEEVLNWSSTWQGIEGHLTPENRKRFLKMAARLLDGIRSGQIKEIEKALIIKAQKPYGHVAYTRLDPRTGRLVQVKAKGLKPQESADDTRPLKEIVSDLVDADECDAAWAHSSLALETLHDALWAWRNKMGEKGKISRKALLKELDDIEADFLKSMPTARVAKVAGLDVETLDTAIYQEAIAIMRDAMRERRRRLTERDRSGKLEFSGKELREFGGLTLGSYDYGKTFYQTYNSGVKRVRPQSKPTEEVLKMRQEWVDDWRHTLEFSLKDVQQLPKSHQKLLAAAHARVRVLSHESVAGLTPSQKKGHQGDAGPEEGTGIPLIRLYPMGTIFANNRTEDHVTLTHEVAHIVDQWVEQADKEATGHEGYRKRIMLQDLRSLVGDDAKIADIKRREGAEYASWETKDEEWFAEAYRYAYRDGGQMQTTLQPADLDLDKFKELVDKHVERTLQTGLKTGHMKLGDLAPVSADQPKKETPTAPQLGFDFLSFVEEPETPPSEGVSPAADYKEHGTRAKSFKDWFGDWEKGEGSRVVKSDGSPAEQYNMQPIAVYHGTTSGGFRQFHTDNVNNLYGAGAYFTEDREIAQEYTSKDEENRWDRATHFEMGGTEIHELPPDILSGVVDEWKLSDYGDWPKKEAKRIIKQHAVDAKKEGKQVALRPLLAELREKSVHVVRVAIEGLEKNSALEAVIPEPEVFEVYLNIRNPIDMDKPVGEDEFKELCKSWDEGHHPMRLNAHTRENYLPCDVKHIADWPLAKEVFEKITGDDWPHSAVLNYQNLKDIKAHIYDEENAKEYQDRGGKYAHKVLRQSPRDQLTWADVYWFATDAQGGIGARKAFRKAAENMGCDGIAHTGGWNVGTKDHRVWIAFNPTQIKATGNEGTFSKDDPDIYKSYPVVLQSFNKSHENFVLTAMTNTGKVKPVGEGKFGARKVTFGNGLSACLKPMNHSTKLFHGIRRNTQHLREVAASQLDRQLLHLDVVPPAVLTMYQNAPASISLWVRGKYAKEIVPNVFNRKLDNWEKKVALFAGKVDVGQIRKVILFDLITNNTDRHAKNCLFGVTGKVWAIDNGLAFGKRFKYYYNVFHRFLFRHQLEIRPDERHRLEMISPEQLTKVLGRYLSVREIWETYQRIQWVLEQDSLGFKSVSQGHEGKAEFPEYRDWFRAQAKPPRGKMVSEIEGMGRLAIL